MEKQIIQYDSPLDAVIALVKRLSKYELHYQMASETFIEKYSNGELDDRIDFIEWAGDYEHFMTIKLDLEKLIHHVA